MFVMPQSAGYTSDMEFDAFQPFATPQLRYEQRFVCGQSSDPYGWGVETTSPQHLAARQSETVSSSSMTSSGPALQNRCTTEDSLYTKVLQIAALESLTDALDYGRLPTGSTASQHMQLPYTNIASNQFFPGSSWLPLSAEAPPVCPSSAHTERPQHYHAAMHDLLASNAALRKQPAASVHAKRPHWADPNWHPKANLGLSTASGAASKGTGVFLPCSYDEPQMAAKPLSRTHSGCSYASKDCASPNSELSRIDSSFSCQSSETDCSYIAAHGMSFYSKLPAGDARRVVGSKIGTLPGRL